MYCSQQAYLHPYVITAMVGLATYPLFFKQFSRHIIFEFPNKRDWTLSFEFKTKKERQLY